MNKTYTTAILFHCYYDLESLAQFIEMVKELSEFENILILISLNENIDYRGKVSEYENLKFLYTTNKGKDIGGKFVLLQLLFQLYPTVEYAALLHDKRSYHKYSGSFEKEQLHSIISNENYFIALNTFEKKTDVGLICTANSIRNEFDYKLKKIATPNEPILSELLRKYELKISDYRFSAGTMFWIRTKILKKFFTTYNIAEIRSTFEAGNVLDHEKGTVTHSWERFLSWIVTAQNYKLHGIDA